MEKRLFLAIAASFLIIYGFSRLAPRQEQAQPQSNSVSPIVANEQKAVLPEPATDGSQLSDKQCVTKSFPSFDLLLEQPSNAISAITYKSYAGAEFALKNGLKVNMPGLVLENSKTSDSGFENYYKSGPLDVVQEFSYNSNYYSDLQIRIKNAADSQQIFTLPIYLGRFDFSQKSGQPGNTNIQDVTVSTAEKVSYPHPRKEALFGKIDFIGMRNKYFAAIIDPADQEFSGFIKPFSSQLVDVGLTSEPIVLLPGQERIFSFKVYLGPQDVDILNKTDLSWAAVVYYGKFNFFAHILLSALKITYKLIHNWGIAIILVSVLIYLLLFPLTLKGFKTMKLTQELKPKIDQLQAQYKGDPQRLNREMIQLYKENKINPLSGCLPFILQIPIFGAFFLVLSRLIEIKGAHFLWINDLSEPDRLIVMKNAIPFIGSDINLLPVLFLIISFIQQKFTPASTGASAEQQKIFMFMTPVILGVVFYHMPSGLLLYSCVNAALMVLQMAFMAKKA